MKAALILISMRPSFFCCKIAISQAGDSLSLMLRRRLRLPNFSKPIPRNCLVQQTLADEGPLRICCRQPMGECLIPPASSKGQVKSTDQRYAMKAPLQVPIGRTPNGVGCGVCLLPASTTWCIALAPA